MNEYGHFQYKPIRNLGLIKNEMPGFSEKSATLMVVSILMWSLSNVVAKSLSGFHFIDLVFYRSVVSTIIFALLGVYYSTRIKNLSRVAIRGAFSGLSLILSYMAIPFLSVSNVGVLNQLAPLITMLLAMLILGEQIALRQVWFGLLCLAGVSIAYEVGSIEVWRPTFFLLMAIVSSAIGYIFVRKGNGTENAISYAASSSIICVIGCAPFVAYNEILWHSSREFILLLILGVLTGTAQILANRAYQLTDASKVTVFNYLSVPFALLLGYIFFNEEITPLKGIGALIILGGVMTNYYFEKKQVT